jgi:hypothetical protein
MSVATKLCALENCLLLLLLVLLSAARSFA